MIRQTKKGSTMMGWIEAMAVVTLMITSIVIISTQLNADYGKNYDLTYGLSNNATQSELNKLTNNIRNSTSEGQTSITDYGILKWTAAPSLVIVTFNMLWTFLSGAFIADAINLIHMGSMGMAIAAFMQFLWLIALGFLLLRMVLRINI